jgi:hypothetical protein
MLFFTARVPVISIRPLPTFKPGLTLKISPLKISLVPTPSPMTNSELSLPLLLYLPITTCPEPEAIVAVPADNEAAPTASVEFPIAKEPELYAFVERPSA